MLASTIVSMIILGLIVGLLSGFFGIGGGVIIVPIIAMHYDFQLALMKYEVCQKFYLSSYRVI